LHTGPPSSLMMSVSGKKSARLRQPQQLTLTMPGRKKVKKAKKPCKHPGPLIYGHCPKRPCAHGARLATGFCPQGPCKYGARLANGRCPAGPRARAPVRSREEMTMAELKALFIRAGRKVPKSIKTKAALLALIDRTFPARASASSPSESEGGSESEGEEVMEDVSKMTKPQLLKIAHQRGQSHLTMRNTKAELLRAVTGMSPTF